MTTVPNSDRAVVDFAKVEGYLLALSHPVGQAKARFFGRFGFRSDAPDALVQALLAHIRDNAIADVESFAFGTKYRVDGPLVSPDGRNPSVSTVWMVPDGETSPRLVTAFPC
jgi:hypothetical protein